MKTLVIFLNGVSVIEPFTFCNGFTLSKLSSLSNTDTIFQLKNIIGNDNPCILHISVTEGNYNSELFDLGVFTTEMISLGLRSHVGVEILAASDYCTNNIPNINRYGISQSLEKTDLTIVDDKFRNFDKRTKEEKEKIKIAVMYLNKSKICQKNVNGNYEHAIFFRVALENCFGSPRKSIQSTIAHNASVLLDQFDSLDVKRKVKRIYSQTSVAVHSGSVPKKPKNNSKERKVKIEDYYMHDILVMSINKIIVQGFPDWAKNTQGYLSRFKNKICAILKC